MFRCGRPGKFAAATFAACASNWATWRIEFKSLIANGSNASLCIRLGFVLSIGYTQTFPERLNLSDTN